MMMMGFGGMMNAGSMGMQNPYMMQQQMAMQQPPRVGESPFPPPVQGNPYEPQKKEKESLFKLPNVSMPNADWGEVAYNSSLALGAGAVAGAGLGVANNYLNAPNVREVYEIKDAGKPVAEQIFEKSDGYPNRVSRAHITGDGVNATVNYEYAPERGRIKRFFRLGNDHDLLDLTVKNGDKTITLERSGWFGKDYKLQLEDGKEVIYRQEKNGEFKPHKAVIGDNEVLHFDNNSKVKKGNIPSNMVPEEFKLNKQLGLPEGAKIQTRLPSGLKSIEGRPIDGRLLNGLGKWAVGAAAASAVIAGGYTAWKTSQPKSEEEILKSLPTELLPATDPMRVWQEYKRQNELKT